MVRMVKAKDVSPRPWFRLVSAAVLALFLVAVLLPLRGVAAATYGDLIEVTEVLVDAVVTDGQGNTVLGLGKDDFIVREDGKPMELNDVTFYSNRAFLGASEVAAELGIDPDATPVNRYFILFFHHQRQLLPRLGANLLDAGRRAKQWVRSSLQLNDYVAIASYFPKLNIQDFSNDPELLAETIDLAVQGKDFPRRSESVSGEIPSLTEAVPEGDADRIYEAIAMVAEGAGAVRGRKNLILYSIGFGRPEAFGFYLPDPRYYPDMIQTLNDNHVAVYPIDLLATDLSPVLTANRLGEVLHRMSVETGGYAYYNFTNYLTPLEWITSDNNGYYLLSYRPEGELEVGEFRKIEVETTNSNFRVRSREGYVVGDDYPYGRQ